MELWEEVKSRVMEKNKVFFYRSSFSVADELVCLVLMLAEPNAAWGFVSSGMIPAF